jgi:hypothetical protein
MPAQNDRRTEVEWFIPYQGMLDDSMMSRLIQNPSRTLYYHYTLLSSSNFATSSYIFILKGLYWLDYQQFYFPYLFYSSLYY